MSTAAAPALAAQPKAIRAILAGGLACGILDITAAFVTWGVRGVGPIRILHSVASGLLGRDAAVAGGLATAALGLFLHFVIAFGAATTYYLASRKLDFLRRSPFVNGPLYGIAVWLFMNFVVLPLSAVGMPKFEPLGVVVGLIVHMLCVGTPIALAVNRFAR
jgi:hypothetical protein